jgi:hypothetical protein
MKTNNIFRSIAAKGNNSKRKVLKCVKENGDLVKLKACVKASKAHEQITFYPPLPC